jgi:fructose-1,6-bisphosphatase/inositol monophosphatase family enzyme
MFCKGEDSGDICFIADPLDGSAFARQRIPLASSSLCAYSRSLVRPVASVVTDVFLGITYLAADHLSGAFYEHDDWDFQIVTSGCNKLANAKCTALGAQPKRFKIMASQERFCSSVQWLLNTGGALDICRVAAGDLDVAVEFAKGFRIWDVAAAGHILKRAGGVFAMPDGCDIVLPEKLDKSSLAKRSKFIAAANEALFAQIQEFIDWEL